MNHELWKRVSRDEPCPICDKPDWCFVSHDGSVAICARVEQGSVRRAGEAGWLHRLREPDDRQPRKTRPIAVRVSQPPEPRPDLAELATRFRDDVEPGRLAWLAQDLGVGVASLQRLGIGWCDSSNAWSFPMVSPDGQLLGFRLRTERGRKFSVSGGREGLFIPADFDGSGLLLIAEGPTDTAALLGLGFEVVGRPSCTGGRAMLVALVLRLRPTEIVILADPDRPGLQGAAELARTLSLHHRRVSILEPPEGIKDARAWVQSGATRLEVEAAIRQAQPIRSSVRIRLSAEPQAEGGRGGD